MRSHSVSCTSQYEYEYGIELNIGNLIKEEDDGSFIKRLKESMMIREEGVKEV